ncbi:hypothetical protein W97_00827 [Coniosporium apollinis CBS 100218]|uniref:Uncharacterized protein n=1 Tax=Coniosporium apollinis (strain CBS 100218) TaxID=1168221 RepID=R7YI86_CONA1|nr:uncharacterized protein W97_00827 [Coniosporium apollinis CBS 100218]EON61612.1 hypothetical protein W97_00827 [Coniosporium apollinis CBS 100218]
MACYINSNITIADGLQHWQFEASLAMHALCGASYLRPDVSGSMFPYPYIILWLAIHCPLIIIRVVRWEKVQVLALVLAGVSVAFCIQAYSSTGRRPDEVLVWMPLTLLLDVGATLQVFWLIVEDAGFRPLVCALRQWVVRAVPGRDQSNAGGSGRYHPRTRSRESVADVVSPLNIPMVPIPAGPDLEGRVSRQVEDELEARLVAEAGSGYHGSLQVPKRGPVGKAFIAMLAAILCIILVVLQILGLVSADMARQHTKDLTVEWCSPMFQVSALAVLDGNCQFHPIKSAMNKILGCIDLPATQQIDWLNATVMILSVSLCCEAFDTVLLASVNFGCRWRGMRMRRPWLSMIGGVLVLVVMAVVGQINASSLPQGMGTVWVYRREPSLGAMTVCQGRLADAGIRGSILGWTDGFLNSWGTTYYGG